MAAHSTARNFTRPNVNALHSDPVNPSQPCASRLNQAGTSSALSRDNQIIIAWLGTIGVSWDSCANRVSKVAGYCT